MNEGVMAELKRVIEDSEVMKCAQLPLPCSCAFRSKTAREIDASCRSRHLRSAHRSCRPLSLSLC